MGGVTDLLIEGARTAAAGDAARYQVIGGQLREKHETAIRTLITSDVERIAVFDEVDGLLDEFEKLCYGIYVLRDATPKAMAKVSSLGVEQQRVKVIVKFLPADLERLRRERDLGVDYRVRVRIFTAEKPGALVVPRSAVFRGPIGDWRLYAVRGGKARLQTVELGLSNDEQAEITSGVTEGELVILAPETNLVEGQSVSPQGVSE